MLAILSTKPLHLLLLSRPFRTQPISSVILPPPPPPPSIQLFWVLPSTRVKLCSLPFILYRCATGGPDSSSSGVTPPPTSPDFTAARIEPHRALLWQNERCSGPKQHLSATVRSHQNGAAPPQGRRKLKARPETKIREAVPALF